MEKKNPLRGEERRVISTKLYRPEFANLMKICDAEGKKVNGKLRELIMEEVDEKVGRAGYDKNSLKEFNINTVEEYNNNLTIEKICKVKLVDKIDNNFVQIGRRFLFEEDMFLAGSNIVPRLPRLGMDVSIWEVDFLINNLNEDNKIKKINFKEDLNEFPKHVFDLNNSVVLLSTKFYVEVFTKLSHRIDYDEKYPRLDKIYRIVPISETILENKIIIIDSDAILWEKKKFHNQYTGKEEKIDLQVKPVSNFQAEILVRSINKIKMLDPELIKILEVEN